MTFRIPTLDAKLAVTAVTAGAFATIGFDLFGQTVSPLLASVPTLGAKLAPVPLAEGSLAVLTGLDAKTISSNGLGHAVHVLTGLLAYPFGYLLAARPLSNAVLRAPWWVTGALYGIALWVFALYVMAHLVAGLPAFLGFTGITWVALWGHVLFGLIVAGISRLRREPREEFESEEWRSAYSPLERFARV